MNQQTFVETVKQKAYQYLDEMGASTSERALALADLIAELEVERDEAREQVRLAAAEGGA